MKEFAVFLALLVPAMGQPQPWEKASEQWSNADAKRILTESPWAKPTKLQFLKTSKTQEAQAKESQSPSLRVTVRFESANPVQLALRKLGLMSVVEATPSDCAVVVEFPAGTAAYRVAAGDWHDAQAWLEPGGTSRIQAFQVRSIEQAGGVVALAFLFKQTPDLTSARYVRLPVFLKRNLKTITFDGHLGTLAWKQTFSVSAMIYQGRLEL